MQNLVSHKRNNNIILDKACHWDVLLFNEALMNKCYKLSLNCGLKASQELNIF